MALSIRTLSNATPSIVMVRVITLSIMIVSIIIHSTMAVQLIVILLNIVAPLKPVIKYGKGAVITTLHFLPNYISLSL
jgi:hypothetical protein